jgi:hypothetical protein
MDRGICSKMPGIFKLVSVDWERERERERAVQTSDMEKLALDHVDRDEGVSIGQVGEEFNVSHMTI